VIDFAGERLDSLPADKPLTAVVTAEPEQSLLSNSFTRTGDRRVEARLSDRLRGSQSVGKGPPCHPAACR